MASRLLLPIFSRSKKASLFSKMILSRLILMLPWTSWFLMAVNADMAMAILSLASWESFSITFFSAPEKTEIQSMFSMTAMLNFCYEVINCGLDSCGFWLHDRGENLSIWCVHVQMDSFSFPEEIPCSWKMFLAAGQERRWWRTTSSSSWWFPWQSRGQDFSIMAEMSFPNLQFIVNLSKSFASDLLCIWGINSNKHDCASTKQENSYPAICENSLPIVFF